MGRELRRRHADILGARKGEDGTGLDPRSSPVLNAPKLSRKTFPSKPLSRLAPIAVDMKSGLLENRVVVKTPHCPGDQGWSPVSCAPSHKSRPISPPICRQPPSKGSVANWD